MVVVIYLWRNKVQGCINHSVGYSMVIFMIIMEYVSDAEVYDQIPNDMWHRIKDENKSPKEIIEDTPKIDHTIWLDTAGHSDIHTDISKKIKKREYKKWDLDRKDKF